MTRSRTIPKLVGQILVLLLLCGACTRPTIEEVEQTLAQGQREVDAHAEDPWTFALIHQSLSLQSEAVKPRHLYTIEGIGAPSTTENPTTWQYRYQLNDTTTGLAAVHSELVASLENSGAALVWSEPFRMTPGGGPVVSTGVAAELSVESLGDTLKISLSYVDFVDAPQSNFISHSVTIDSSTD